VSIGLNGIGKVASAMPMTIGYIHDTPSWRKLPITVREMRTNGLQSKSWSWI